MLPVEGLGVVVGIFVAVWSLTVGVGLLLLVGLLVVVDEELLLVDAVIGVEVSAGPVEEVPVLGVPVLIVTVGLVV